jgi:transcriptional repressor NrdR
VLEGLRRLDPVSYLRFASVYKGFEDITDFEREVTELQKQTAPKGRNTAAPKGRIEAAPKGRNTAAPKERK